MLKLKKLVLPTFLAALILLPSAVLAESINNNAVPKADSIQKHDCKKQKDMEKDLNELEKFIPGAKIQLEQAFTKRKELSKQLKDLINSKLGIDTSFMNEFKKTVKDTHNKVKNGQMTEKQAEEYIKEQKEKFNKEHASEIAKMKEVRKKYAGEHPDEITARKQNEKQVRDAGEALEDAVKSGDANKVKIEFNNYLNSLNAFNKLLQNQIDSLK